MDNSIAEVSAELILRLIGPQDTIVPLMAGLYYTSQDPYAIQMAFHVGTDEPVEWTVARDLLAAALHAREDAHRQRLGIDVDSQLAVIAHRLEPNPKQSFPLGE